MHLTIAPVKTDSLATAHPIVVQFKTTVTILNQITFLSLHYIVILRLLTNLHLSKRKTIVSIFFPIQTSLF